MTVAIRILIVGLMLCGVAACESPRTVRGGGSEHGGGAKVGFPITF
jgi:hypothetical protein